MTTIQAWQHIYSNVEKEQSPTKRGGFQTLFYTQAGLTEDEISEMEGRLLYFSDKIAEPVKRLFFTTTTGKAVVAQIVLLPEPDQYGRKGRYLAHALAFAPEDVAKFEADPFRVFRSVDFFTTVKAVLTKGDFQTGDIPAVSLILPDSSTGDVQAAQAWTTGELRNLALLALRAERQAKERQAVTFAGTPEQIEAALEAAFLAVPVALRPRCTFDAYFYRCNLVATFYWAIGLLEPPVSTKFALVDGAAREVQGAAPTQPQTAYERWTLAQIEGQALAEIARQRDQAFALGEWLDQREADETLLIASSPALIGSVFEVNGAAVQSFLRQRLAEALPEALVDRAATYIYQHTPAPELYQALRQGFEVGLLLEILYKSYETQEFAEPAGNEIKALDKLLERHDQPLLRLFSAYWRSNRGYLPQALTLATPLADALTQADEADYRRFGQIALELGLIKPLRLLVPKRGSAFLDVYLATRVEDWVELTEGLIETNQAAYLSRLVKPMGYLARKELTRIDKLIKEQENIPENFQKAVAAAMAALPPEKGLKGMLKAAWRRLPGIDD